MAGNAFPHPSRVPPWLAGSTYGDDRKATQGLRGLLLEEPEPEGRTTSPECRQLYIPANVACQIWQG